MRSIVSILENIMDYLKALGYSDKELQVFAHLQSKLVKIIEDMYPLKNSRVAKMYAEEILDYAHTPICELALDIETEEDNNPELSYYDTWQPPLPYYIILYRVHSRDIKKVTL